MLQKKLNKAQKLQFKNDFLIKFHQNDLQNAPFFEKITIQSNKSKTNSGLTHLQYTNLGNLLRKITGQTGKLIKADKSIASFQLMKGDIIGIKSTLRDLNMESFLEKLLFIVHVGESSNILPNGKPYIHPKGIIQWGSPIYFYKLKYETKENFG